MRLATLLRSTTRIDESDARPRELSPQVRERRVEVARSNPRWTELAAIDLVRRGPFWVSASTDELFTVRRGVVFEPGSAAVFEQTASLHFYVDDDRDLVFLERHARSWSEIVAGKARRGAA